jgi:hypothetical protein
MNTIEIWLMASACLFLLAVPIANAAPTDGPGSVLVFPVVATDSGDPTVQNTVITITNTANTLAYVKCVLLHNDGGQCAQSDFLLLLTPQQPTGFNPPAFSGTGYLVCAQLDSGGNLYPGNSLLGHAYFKTADGVTGSYTPAIYFANFGGTIPDEGILRLGTDYIPGAPAEIYVDNSPSILDGDDPRLYAGSSINPDADDNGVENVMRILAYDESGGSYSATDFGGCWNDYSFSGTPPLDDIGTSFWLGFTPELSGSRSWGVLPGAVFANAGGNYTFAHGVHSSPMTTNADLPFQTGGPLPLLAAPPLVYQISPTEVLDNTIVRFNVTATSRTALTCDLYWDGSNVSSMAGMGGNVWAANHTVTGAGDHSAWANCSDASGNTNKTETTITVNTLAYSYSLDYDGSADPADYTPTFSGERSADYQWADAVMIHVPNFTRGWIFLNLSMPFGATDENLNVLKWDGTNTTRLAPGAYGAPGVYAVAGHRIYINVTASDPDFAVVGPVRYGVEVSVAPESLLAVLAIVGTALAMGALVLLRRQK